MGDRILGAICLVAALAMGWAAQSYAAEISYEPVGPRAFPLVLAAVMGGVGLWLLVKRGAVQSAGGITPTLKPTSATDWKAVAMCAATVLVYGALFQWLGFWLATTLMALPVGMAFGGTFKNALIGGLSLGLGLYLLFDKVFDVILPTGLLAFILGGR